MDRWPRRKLVALFCFFCLLATVGGLSPGSRAAAAEPSAAPPIWAPAPAPLTEADAALYRRAFALADKRKLTAALRLAEQGEHPLPKKVLRWYYLHNNGSGARFEEIAAFIEDNPDWPHRNRLRRHAEEAIGKSTPPAPVVAFFRKYPPLTTEGYERYAEALRRTGDLAGAEAQLREAWVVSRFYGAGGHAEQKRFLRRHGKLIGPAEHFARAKKLLWVLRLNNAYRYLSQMTPEDRALVTAWGRLLRRSTPRSKIEAALAALPDDLRNDPGVRYAELRRHTLHDRDDRARAILHDPPPFLGDSDSWWIQRSIQTRRALEQRHYEEAYRLASKHGLADGRYQNEAEFLAGWIALRFLGKPDVARLHFARVYGEASLPIGQARGAYWMGRAVEAIGQIRDAELWYVKAARYTATYYGQLAAVRLGPGFQPVLPPAVDAATQAAFESWELVRVVRLLDDVGAGAFEKAFLGQVLEQATTPAERLLAAELSSESGSRPAAIDSARKAHQLGDPVVPVGYPVMSMPPDAPRGLEGPEDALVLAIIRQESQFNEHAMSGAGARGLMQLMPGTARHMARTLRMRYVKANLTRDPDYNIQLGRAYLARMLASYDGHYALALAAYNAGPNRVDRWTQLIGDPRSPTVDPIDWVEMIPYRETRGYVQRVLESLQVYRWRLGKANLVPQRVADMYAPVGAHPAIVATEPLIVPASGTFDGKPKGVATAGEDDDAASKVVADEDLPPPGGCDPDLPRTDPFAC